MTYIESRHRQKSQGTPAQVTISVVAPFASQAAVIIEHAYVGTLSPHPELLRSSDSKRGRLLAAFVLTIFGIFKLHLPHIIVPYDVVSRIRNRFLLKSRFSHLE